MKKGIWWVARDKNNSLWLFLDEKPEKNEEEEIWTTLEMDVVKLDIRLFPEVQWSDDEPTKVKLVIDK